MQYSMVTTLAMARRLQNYGNAARCEDPVNTVVGGLRLLQWRKLNAVRCSVVSGSSDDGGSVYADQCGIR